MLAAQEPTPAPDATSAASALASPTPTPADVTTGASATPTPTPLPDDEREEEEDDDDDEYVDPRPMKRTAVAGWLGLFFPGLGHHYLGEHTRGFVFLGAESVELTAAVVTVSTSGWDPDNPADTRYQRALLPLAWLQNTHLLGVYDAWRLARLRAPEGRFRTPTPTPATEELLWAPLAFGQLRRPGVAIPLAAVFGAGIGLSYLAREEGPGSFYELDRIPVFSREVDRSAALGVALGYYGTTFYAVGIGEEALFRGVIQTAFEEKMGPTFGWLTATAFFGLLHAANGSTPGQSAVAVGVTSVVGGYLGWMYQRDGYDLTGPTFFHTWYDVGIGLTVFLLDPENQPFTASFSVPF